MIMLLLGIAAAIFILMNLEWLVKLVCFLVAFVVCAGAITFVLGGAIWLMFGH